MYDYLVERLSDEERLDALSAATATLERDFGSWRIPWGEINRFQRLTDELVQPFDDAKPSLPVGFAPSNGALWHRSTRSSRAPPSGFTGRTATASSPRWNSARRCAPRPS